MILSPAVIALISGSFLVCGFALYASLVGIRILYRWDLRSGAESQLLLERKTYLISTIFSCLLAVELFSLLIFVHTADHLHDRFIGAMCAAGTLNVNGYGYPTLFLKMSICILCGIWLMLNYTDNRGYDYPLIRPKYRFMLVITALLLLENYTQFRFFREMRPNLITSCCGVVFNEDVPSLAGGASSIPPATAVGIFFASMILTLRTGIYFFLTGKAARLFSWLSGWMFLYSMIAAVSFIAVYYYELPTHHCPFCILQREYHFIGYPLYFFLYFAGICGIGVGVIDRMKGPASIRAVIPSIQRHLSVLSVAGYSLFALITLYPMVFSDFILIGY